MDEEKRQRREPAFDHFGLLAPWYERVIRPAQTDVIVSLLKPEQGQNLLDVGGGTGRILKALPHTFAETVLLDASRRMLLHANTLQQVFPAQGLAEALPFHDGAFHRIIAVDSFHHFRNRTFAASEFVRILAPGGRLVIEEPDIRRFPVKLIALGETLLLMRSHFQPPKRICRYFARPGLNVTVHENGSPNFWIVVDKNS